MALTLISGSAIAFSVVNERGTTEKFSDISTTGDFLLVMVWSHDCFVCEQQKPLISSFADRTKTKGISVLGLSSDNLEYRDEASTIIENSQTKFDNYLYNGDEFEKDYLRITGEQFLGAPTYLVYNPDGTLIGAHVGPIERKVLNKYFSDKASKQPTALSADMIR